MFCFFFENVELIYPINSLIDVDIIRGLYPSKKWSQVTLFLSFYNDIYFSKHNFYIHQRHSKYSLFIVFDFKDAS